MEKLCSSEQGTSWNPRGYKAVSLVIPLSATTHKSDCMNQWLNRGTNLPHICVQRGSEEPPSKKRTPNSTRSWRMLNVLQPSLTFARSVAVPSVFRLRYHWPSWRVTGSLGYMRSLLTSSLGIIHRHDECMHL